MVKETVTYKNFDGETVTEELRFNLTQAELFELNAKYGGDLKTSIEKAVQSENAYLIYTMFKDVILSSYGEKSADGKRFVKNKELSEAFAATDAYSELILSLANNEEKMKAFMTSILPKAE